MAIVKVEKPGPKQAMPKYCELDTKPNSEPITLDVDVCAILLPAERVLVGRLYVCNSQLHL